MTDSQTLYGLVNGKTPEIIVNSSSYSNVFRKLKHPHMVQVKRAFDRIFNGVNSREDSNLSENQQLSEPFNSFLYIPSESLVNRIYNDAAPASENTAPIIQFENEEEDSDRTPSPHPQKYVSLINKNIAQMEDSLEDDETQPSEPSQHKPQTPPPEHGKQSSPDHTIPSNLGSDVAQPSNSTVHDVEKSPQHVDMDNTSTIATPLKQHLQQIKELMKNLKELMII
jgi:hypothetical protein